MYKVKFNLDVQNYLAGYFRYYREYYEILYKDSGLWNENQIIDGYINESQKRKEEIIKLIEDYFSGENIIGKKLDNTMFLRWKTKYIFINWLENKSKKIRYILDIEIR